VTKTFVAHNEFPHVTVACNTKKVGQACNRGMFSPFWPSIPGFGRQSNKSFVWKLGYNLRLWSPKLVG